MKYLISLIAAGSIALANCAWTETITAKGVEAKTISFQNICFNGKLYVGNLSRGISGVYSIEAIAPVYEGTQVKNCECSKPEVKQRINKDGSVDLVEIYEAK